jgi:hypothetical protein
MPSWLDRWTGRGRDGDAEPLPARLRRYPPYRAPHRGPPSLWTLDQARENFDRFGAARDERMGHVASLLREYGVDLSGALAGGDYLPALEALHAWVNDRWPALHDPAIATPAAWLASSREGREIVYSLVLDIAIVLGELVVRRRPAYAWRLHLDEIDGRDDMPSYRRAVVAMAPVGLMPAAIVLDFEELVASRYWSPGSAAERLSNGWARTVTDAIDGRYEAAWRPVDPSRS